MKKLLCFVLVFLALPAHARIDLTAMLEASRSRNVPLLARMSEAAQGDVLEMYPRYHWLTIQIATLAETEANNFLARYPNTPLAERFRIDWLKELARRQNWPAYVAEYPKLESPTTELVCYRAQAGLALNDEAPLNAVRPLWFTGQDLPSACAPVFGALFGREKLTGEDAWKRIRLALFDDNLDLVPSIAQAVGATEAFNYKKLLTLRAKPEKAWPQADTRAGREISLYILSRITRNDPENAAHLLAGIEGHWPQADRAYGWRMIGVIAAKKHHPQANAWLNRGGKEEMDGESRAWAIRAGLFAGDWKGVIDRIETLPERERQETTWRYWRARAWKELGRTQDATQMFSIVAGSSDFYGLLAREELGTVLEAPAVQYRASEDEIRGVQQLAGIQRAHALFQQNWRTEGVREWNWAMKGLNDQMLLAAAELARRQSWPDRAIYSAERTKQLHDQSLRYLAPYRDIVDRQARQEGLDPAWVYGLMRQESRFVTEARSGPGARGLMQLMPATAKWVAQKLGWKKFNLNDTNDISINVALGSRYLREVAQSLNNSQVLASAAYNAGPGRARAWQADVPLDAAIYIENIPFSETRDYVKKVMANAVHYSHILGTGQSSLKARIGTIPAKGSTVPDLP